MRHARDEGIARTWIFIREREEKKTRYVLTGDIYACTTWSFRASKISSPQSNYVQCSFGAFTSMPLLSFSERKEIYSLRNYLKERKSTHTHNFCTGESQHAERVRRRCFSAAHRTHTSLISAEHRVHNNHIGDSRFSIDQVLDLITYLFPLH